MRAHVQRLAAVDDSIADIVLVDVGSVLAFAGSETKFWEVVSGLRDACRRGHRKDIWIVAPGPERPAKGVPIHLAPRDFASVAAREVMWRVYSKELVCTLAFETVSIHRGVTVVVGSFAEYQTCFFSKTSVFGDEVQAIASILELRTGRLWTAQDCAGRPEVAARAEATLRLATKNYKPQYREALVRQMSAGLDVFDAHATYKGVLAARADPSLGSALPDWLTNPWKNGRASTKTAFLDALDAEERRLAGWRKTNTLARNAFRNLIATLPAPRLDTGYVCASVRRGINHWHVDEVHCRFRDRWRHADRTQAAGLLSNFLAEFPERWFGPRMIDLLAWMEDSGLPLPARAGDPAWSAFVLAPEKDLGRALDLRVFSARVLSLTAEARTWLGDLRREAPPPREIESLARALPDLDYGLRAVLKPPQVTLLETDIEPSIPVVAAMEARGVAIQRPKGYPAWESFSSDLEQELRFACNEARAVLRTNIDIFGEAKLIVRAAENAVGKLVDVERDGVMMKELLPRYFAAFPALECVARARALGAMVRERPLHDAITSAATSVHAVTVPQKNGRLGLRRPRLQSLPKESVEGVLLRSAFTARPDMVFVAADYNAFEARIAAELSGDPLLVHAAAGADLFLELAKIFFNTSRPTGHERMLAKLGFYGILFGQTNDRFWKKQYELARSAAEDLFDCATKHLGGLLTYRDRVYASIKKYPLVTTRGGWTRSLGARTLPERQRDGFSGEIQGLAADILRRVLRELRVLLAPFGAGVVHHEHDDVVVETPVAHVQRVALLLETTMTEIPSAAPALVERVPLLVRTRTGHTWADLV